MKRCHIVNIAVLKAQAGKITKKSQKGVFLSSLPLFGIFASGINLPAANGVSI